MGLRVHCAICGTTKLSYAQWFFVTEWDGPAQGVGWNRYAGNAQQVHCVCSRHHARELIFHWMRTGCLQYPFTATLRARQRPQKQAPERETLSPSELQPLAEVIVDRDSIERILTDNPLSLNTLLDELMMVLEKEVGDGRQDEFDCEYWMPTGR